MATYWVPLSVEMTRSVLKASWGLILSTRASRLYTEASFRPGDALVFGPESRGLPRKLIEDNPGRALRIPMRPEARSLNLANAAAIGLYEAYRQVGGG